tara:strand:- start:6912 stop:7625 length:714 start_codon:yes stop_codon:yes gene_type:complete
MKISTNKKRYTRKKLKKARGFNLLESCMGKSCGNNTSLSKSRNPPPPPQQAIQDLATPEASSRRNRRSRRSSQTSLRHAKSLLPRDSSVHCIDWYGRVLDILGNIQKDISYGKFPKRYSELRKLLDIKDDKIVIDQLLENNTWERLCQDKKFNTILTNIDEAWKAHACRPVLRNKKNNFKQTLDNILGKSSRYNFLNGRIGRCNIALNDLENISKKRSSAEGTRKKKKKKRRKSRSV